MIKKLQALRAKKGFTLVELIVVIAIIGVLAAILIPTLSGVIESSRKRSAESTCQSIQNLAKTYVSQYSAKTGADYAGGDSDTVDMDDGNGKQTMKKYIESQIPELASSSGDTKRAATIYIKDGKVDGVTYQEGSYKSVWTAKSGLAATTKEASAPATVGATITAGAAPDAGGDEG
ncbi:MAG: type II secretion system GspH family protein [Oscillospiraceae bacterium]|nr:type II secretion system GspH family protein [Oscillospiraceae bacterium]